MSATVSTIAGNDECPFAIKGGGHAPQAGAANVVSHALEIMPPEHEHEHWAIFEGCLAL